MSGWFVGWLIGWLVGLAGWLFDGMVGPLVGFDGLVGPLVGYLVVWKNKASPGLVTQVRWLADFFGC